MLWTETVESSNTQPLDIMGTTLGDETVVTDVKTTGPVDVLVVLVNIVLLHLALSNFHSFYLI